MNLPIWFWVCSVPFLIFLFVLEYRHRRNNPTAKGDRDR
mgnify:CR=1 FL=1